VKDAIGDLPEECTHSATYMSAPICNYQRNLRRSLQLSSGIPRVKDHIFKELAPLTVARIEQIPLLPGSDWRDLPNIRHPLSDELLLRSWNIISATANTDLEGVSVVRGRYALFGLEMKQEDTLIPWCLVHTASRHTSGLVYTDDFTGMPFPTTVTNPEPISKQGQVIHPKAHRVLSVRECARSQGFPDDFVFVGNTMDKYRQLECSTSATGCCIG